ncbi:MAG: acylphosphatase [Mesorhizobium amorphae]|nr:MAG: acylphosphatase [Mesorhizobium amorphae]
METVRHETEERMTIWGSLAPELFAPWIRRHAQRIGLQGVIGYCGEERIELDVSGASELIDMMEVACSLGPIGVWVETIERVPLRRNSV